MKSEGRRRAWGGEFWRFLRAGLSCQGDGGWARRRWAGMECTTGLYGGMREPARKRRNAGPRRASHRRVHQNGPITPSLAATNGDRCRSGSSAAGGAAGAPLPLLPPPSLLSGPAMADRDALEASALALPRAARDPSLAMCCGRDVGSLFCFSRQPQQAAAAAAAAAAPQQHHCQQQQRPSSTLPIPPAAAG